MLDRLFQIVKMFATPLKLYLSTQMVNLAYRYPGKSAHRLISAVGRRWFGIEGSSRRIFALCQWFMDCIFQAQHNFFKARPSGALDLGAAGIGFDGLRIRCSTENANSSVVYLLGFESDLTQFDIYRLFAKPGTAVIDVGANIGIHSLVLSICVGGGGKVYAFEPVPSIRTKMEENLKINTITNVQLYEYALGNSLGKVSFRANTTDFNIGKGCVDPEGDILVPITTIDHEFGDIELPVSMIKIDTEGHELEVLKGAAGLLKKHRPTIEMEFNFRSYSLLELKHHIPLRYSYFELAKRPNQRFRLVQGDLLYCCELLMVPDEKLHDEPATPSNK
jgi:FkbM family methyltransferase